MKRDMELVRKLLFAMEDPPLHAGRRRNPEIEGYDADTIAHHVHLLAQAGYLKAADVTNLGHPFKVAVALELTWNGHDAIDAIRNDTVWNKAKDQALKAGGASVGVVVELAKAYVRQQLGFLRVRQRHACRIRPN